jgi:hypothetical protein
VLRREIGEGHKLRLLYLLGPDTRRVEGDAMTASVDGEAAQFDPPLRFRIRPHALRVRIAPGHPAASPSALEPDGAWHAVRALAGIATGHDPRPLSGATAA